MAHGVISEKVIWIRLAVIIIPLLVLLCGINYYEDPANLFHDYNENVAKALLDGREAYFGSGNGDERWTVLRWGPVWPWEFQKNMPEQKVIIICRPPD